MKYKIIFSENAKKDLISIVRYISDELLEPNIAEKLSYRILKAVKSLDEFPNRHRLCDYPKWTTFVRPFYRLSRKFIKIPAHICSFI